MGRGFNTRLEKNLFFIRSISGREKSSSIWSRRQTFVEIQENSGDEKVKLKRAVSRAKKLGVFKC